MEVLELHHQYQDHRVTYAGGGGGGTYNGGTAGSGGRWRGGSGLLQIPQQLMELRTPAAAAAAAGSVAEPGGLQAPAAPVLLSFVIHSNQLPLASPSSPAHSPPPPRQARPGSLSKAYSSASFLSTPTLWRRSLETEAQHGRPATLVMMGTPLEDGTTLYGDSSIDVSTQPSGTSMKYRIITANSKAITIYGAVFQWGAVTALSAANLTVSSALTVSGASTFNSTATTTFGGPISSNIRQLHHRLCRHHQQPPP